MNQLTNDLQTKITRRKTISLLAASGLFSLPVLGSLNSKANNLPQKHSEQMKGLMSNEGVFKKTIGILGGLGPQATIDLETRIHKIAQQRVRPAQNSNYPAMVVHYYRHAPVLLADEHTPVFPFQPDPRLMNAARILGQSADFILIASNGVHMFQTEIEEASGKKVLSMIDSTIDEVKKKGWKKVGALGLMNAQVYTKRLEQLNIGFETIDDALQMKLNQSIFRVMEGTETNEDRAIAREAINQLRGKKCDGIIPGCTEIPLLLGEYMNADDIINPAQLIAETAVEYSL